MCVFQRKMTQNLGCFVLLSLCGFTSLTSAAFTPISTSECAKTKSCFFKPTSCSGEDCTYFASWKPVNVSNVQYVEIELSGAMKSSSGYMAIGFSDDNRMVSLITLGQE